MPVFLRLLIVVMFIAGNLYFGHSSVSIINLFFIVTLAIIPAKAKQLKLDKRILLFLSLFLILFFIGFVYLIFTYEEPEHYKQLYYLFYFFWMPFMFYVIYKRTDNFSNIVFNSLNAMIVLGLGIIIFELFTGIHLPVHNDQPQFKNVPSGYFTNPNDMAAITVMLYPFIFYYAKKNKLKKQLYLMSAVILLINIIVFSRISFLLLLAFPIFFQLIKQRYKAFLFLTVGITLFFVYLFSVDIKYYSDPNTPYERNVNRFAAFLDEVKDDESSSFSQRFMVYRFPFEHPDELMLTGYGFKGANKRLKGKTELLVKDPHSLFIELIFNFGFLGALPLLTAVFILAIKLLSRFRQHEKYRYAFIQLLYFALLVNISSSVMKKPIIWLPFTLVIFIVFISNFKIIYSKSDEKKN